MKLLGRRLLLLFILAALPVTAPAASSFGRFHAVVIGNQNYRHLGRLQTPLADAKEVAAVLTGQYGFTVDLLLDKTRDEIMLTLSTLRKTMTSEDDSLLIYYAGHGYLDETTSTGYWQPVDAQTDNTVYWIPTDEISRLLKALAARHVLVVADSCYSGTLLRDSGAKLPAGTERDEWLKRMQAKRSRTALTSGGEEPVADGGGSGHSVFAKAFLDALRENKGILDGDSLFDRIKRPVILNAPQTPLYGDIKMTGHEMGDFLLVPKDLQGDVPQGQPKQGTDLRFLQRGDGDAAAPQVKQNAAEQPSQKEPKQGDTMTDPATGMEFVALPGGCFMMGSPENEKGREADEGPVRKVCVDSFWMGKYEVTQEQWQKITGENPSYFKKGGSYPVETISWDEAQEFIKKLNSTSGRQYRLPTEAEWEYACRANASGTYCGGDDIDAVAWYNKNSAGPQPVGRKQANAFGLHDMNGNVWEWCADAASLQNNPAEPAAGSSQATRGGGWDDGPKTVRAAARFMLPPDNSHGNLGFRIVLPGQQGI